MMNQLKIEGIKEGESLHLSYEQLKNSIEGLGQLKKRIFQLKRLKSESIVHVSFWLKKTMQSASSVFSKVNARRTPSEFSHTPDENAVTLVCTSGIYKQKSLRVTVQFQFNFRTSFNYPSIFHKSPSPTISITQSHEIVENNSDIFDKSRGETFGSESTKPSESLEPDQPIVSTVIMGAGLAPRHASLQFDAVKSQFFLTHISGRTTYSPHSRTLQFTYSELLIPKRIAIPNVCEFTIAQVPAGQELRSFLNSIKKEKLAVYLIEQAQILKLSQLHGFLEQLIEMNLYDNIPRSDIDFILARLSSSQSRNANSQQPQKAMNTTQSPALFILHDCTHDISYEITRIDTELTIEIPTSPNNKNNNNPMKKSFTLGLAISADNSIRILATGSHTKGDTSNGVVEMSQITLILDASYNRIGLSRNEDHIGIGELEFKVMQRNLGMVSDIGTRKSNEDALLYVEDLNVESLLPNRCSLFAVIDGHGGTKCAKFLRDNLSTQLGIALQGLSFSPESSSLSSTRKQFEITLRNRLRIAFYELDAIFQERFPKVSAICGATLVAVLLIGSTAFTCWIGDCQAHAILNEHLHVSLTEDHLPTRVDELARITSQGGTVAEDGSIEGTMLISRCIGQFECKRTEEYAQRKFKIENAPMKSLVSSEVEISTLDLMKCDTKVIVGESDVSISDNAECTSSILLLTSDGLLAIMPIEEVLEFIKNAAQYHKSAQQICEEIIADCTKKAGSRDNITLILLLYK